MYRTGEEGEGAPTERRLLLVVARNCCKSQRGLGDRVYKYIYLLSGKSNDNNITIGLREILLLV